MRLGIFLSLFLIGLFEGVFLSSISNFAFETFVTHSLNGYLGLSGVIALLLVGFWTVPRLIENTQRIQGIRVMLLGIGVASFVVFLYTLIVYSRASSGGSWVLVMYDGPPYIGIMGVPFPAIVWSLFLGSFFTALERLLKVWKELRE